VGFAVRPAASMLTCTLWIWCPGRVCNYQQVGAGTLTPFRYPPERWSGRSGTNGLVQPYAAQESKAVEGADAHTELEQSNSSGPSRPGRAPFREASVYRLGIAMAETKIASGWPLFMSRHTKRVHPGAALRADRVGDAVWCADRRRLPGGRGRARRLGVNPRTAHLGYRRLCGGGAVEMLRGAGAFVARGATPAGGTGLVQLALHGELTAANYHGSRRGASPLPSAGLAHPTTPRRVIVYDSVRQTAEVLATEITTFGTRPAPSTERADHTPVPRTSP
jgi:hypothetical protein